MTTKLSLAEHSGPFLHYLEEWYNGLQPLSLAALLQPEPRRVALLSIDVINGFCAAGPLASDRVGRIAQPIADLFTRAHALGAREFVLTQDTHHPETPEFEAYPPHCLAGSDESEAVAELKALPFYDQITTVKKNSIHSFIGTELAEWVASSSTDTFVVVGDCTDLCTYQAAMHLRLEANHHHLRRRVIVPADVVDTFDTPVSVARELGIKAHDAELHHVLFLHHMASNGIEVVRSLT